MDNPPGLLKKSAIVLILAISSKMSIGQVLIHGTVYDRSQFFALPGVSVMGTSGAGTATDSMGNYHIRLPAGDSIYFSYQGKFTGKFPVKDIDPDIPLNMSLQVTIDSLPQVVVRPRAYRADSLENRREYEKIFNYGGPDYLQSTSTPRGGGVGLGFDFDMLFEGRRNRRMLAFQRRLVEEEQDKYVDHRFNKSLVKRITDLQPPALDTFMRWYRPSYELIQNCENDYEYYRYIQQWGISFSEIWKKEHSN